MSFPIIYGFYLDKINKEFSVRLVRVQIRILNLSDINQCRSRRCATRRENHASSSINRNICSQIDHSVSTDFSKSSQSQPSWWNQKTLGTNISPKYNNLRMRRLIKLTIIILATSFASVEATFWTNPKPTSATSNSTAIPLPTTIISFRPESDVLELEPLDFNFERYTFVKAQIETKSHLRAMKRFYSNSVSLNHII